MFLFGLNICRKHNFNKQQEGTGMARLVERPTEKPGAILTRVRVPGVARDLSPSQFSVRTLTVSVQPLRAITCISICTNVKNPEHRQPYHSLKT